MTSSSQRPPEIPSDEEGNEKISRPGNDSQCLLTNLWNDATFVIEVCHTLSTLIGGEKGSTGIYEVSVACRVFRPS